MSTFNQMIGRLEAAFESMRRFTADAYHELRTPLTIMRGPILPAEENGDDDES